MRVELYGCPFRGEITDGVTTDQQAALTFRLGGVISYVTSPALEKDTTYDGKLILLAHRSLFSNG